MPSRIRKTEWSDLAKELGCVLRSCRNETERSQEALALDAGLDRTYISMVERGERNLTVAARLSICEVLGRPASEILQVVERRLAEATGE